MFLVGENEARAAAPDKVLIGASLSKRIAVANAVNTSLATTQ